MLSTKCRGYVLTPHVCDALNVTIWRAVQSTREANDGTFVIDVAHPRKPERGNTGNEEKLKTGETKNGRLWLINF